jgi:hypothetical protein
MDMQEIKQGDEIKVEGELYNVGESFCLYDTLGVVSNVSSLSQVPPGWFASFAAMGAANDYHFFDIRNMSVCDKAYNNQDTRDQTSFGYLLKNLSVSFFTPYVSQVQDGESTAVEVFHNAIWCAEMPQNSSVSLRVNQDEHLNCNAMMLGSGPGPVGGGVGQGFFGADTESVAVMAHTQGVGDIDNPWSFPIPLGIPRRAAISVVVRPSEWMRRYLLALTGPYNYNFVTAISPAIVRAKFPVMFGIRVTMHGMRLVQPRGAYRA